MEFVGDFARCRFRGRVGGASPSSRVLQGQSGGDRLPNGCDLVVVLFPVELEMQFGREDEVDLGDVYWEDDFPGELVGAW